ncbi:response regulator transcription factor [Rheinheimera sp. 4Y26]|uniref:response regulator transcription factor n=1 Tax=Rheinheimera sp. 4Y26 TaxID=2977811 RepID=UPI0021B0CFF4|nr:response regulator transcription factor [Rheinheimera sp. 4Y26]MCT6698065.1 response regulator transcription factor [Rheinheimera sp. 4Y26]
MNILLAEDQAILRSTLATLLSLLGQHQVVEAENGQQAKQLLRQQKFDLLLTDIEMPGLTGLELVEFLQQEQAGQKQRCKLLILTTFSRAGYVKRAMQAGVDGFLLKDTPATELLAAINKIMAGGKVIAPELAMLALGQDNPLHDKERRALRLSAEGKTTAEIAQLLFLAEGTVRNYLSDAINKLNAANRVDAARIAQQRGWL